MASVARVNQDGRDHGVQYSTAQVTAIEIDAGVSLAAKDGIDGAVAQIVGEFSPLMYKSTGTAGKIFAIIDGHHSDAASLTARLQNMGTVDGVDLSGEVVLVRDLDAFSAT
ncbi:hypothetical protein OAP94_01700 [bacterium]|nr:hypothetical protein [bacterium]MDC1007376.1 hypothetical protein [bacterium]